MIFSIISMLLLAAFVVVAVVHLVRCYQRNLGLSDITKFLLMPLLAAFYLAASFAAGFTLMTVLVLAALVLFWIGDMLLIYDWERASFFFGMFTFMLAQIALIVVSVIFFSRVSFPIIAGLILIPVFIVIFTVKVIFLRKPFAFIGLQAVATMYLLSTTVLSYLLVMLAIANPSVLTVLMAIGGVGFMMSDYHVIQEYYIGGNNLSRFLIMLGYLIGTAFIVIGTAGLQLQAL